MREYSRIRKKVIKIQQTYSRSKEPEKNWDFFPSGTFSQ